MLKLSVISYNDEVSNETHSAVFGLTGGSIGRSPDNSMVLHDPQRLISRFQASVRTDGKRHTIMNLSRICPLYINGEKIASTDEAELHFGDEIRMGLYLLRAESPFGAVPSFDSDARMGAFVSPFAHEFEAEQPTQSGYPPVEVLPLDLEDLKASGIDPIALLGSDLQFANSDLAPGASHGYASA